MNTMSSGVSSVASATAAANSPMSLMRFSYLCVCVESGPGVIRPAPSSCLRLGGCACEVLEERFHLRGSKHSALEVQVGRWQFTFHRQGDFLCSGELRHVLSETGSIQRLVQHCALRVGLCYPSQHRADLCAEQGERQARDERA